MKSWIRPGPCRPPGRIQPPRVRRGGPARRPDGDHPELHGPWPGGAWRRVGPAETATATGNPSTGDLAKDRDI